MVKAKITINRNIIRWYKKLCQFYNVKGDARTYWKKSKDSTKSNSKAILGSYIQDIQNPNKAFIYHCYKHYLTPVGYEITARNTSDIYSKVDKYNLDDSDSWMLIGESSKGYPGIHLLKWQDIEKDITCDNKLVYNIRQTYKGLEKNKEKLNYHRLIILEKLLY